jgi:hypothetical protein
VHHRPRTLVLSQSELTVQQQNLLDYLYREFGIIRPKEALAQAC